MKTELTSEDKARIHRLAEACGPCHPWDAITATTIFLACQTATAKGLNTVETDILAAQLTDCLIETTDLILRERN